jgi:4,5-dihydroxyphthalate decarboxylase
MLAMKKAERKSTRKGMSRRQWLYTAAGAAAATPVMGAGAPQTSKLRLTMSCWDYDRTRALREGQVAFDGIELTYLPLVVEETFFRMLRYHEFDIAELSLSSYTVSLFADKPQFIAIPIFPSRMFRHNGIFINVNSGIRQPKDLAGKRIGTPEYQLTAPVWQRGILSDEYNVPVTSVTHFQGGLEEPGREEKINLNLPPNIKLQPIPAGKTLSQMLEDGEIDALVSPRSPSSFKPGGKVRRLFEDYATVEREYFQRTKIFPVMHVVAIRRDVYEKYPWVAQSLYKGLAQSQKITYEDLHETAALKVMLPWLIKHVEDTESVMGKEFWPYGLEPNVKALSTFLRYSYEQGLAKRLLQPKELFAPESLESFKI